MRRGNGKVAGKGFTALEGFESDRQSGLRASSMMALLQ